MKFTFTALPLLFSLAAGVANAEEFKILPVLSEDYSPVFAIALTAGSLSPEIGDSASLVGAELSLECPLLRVPQNHIRQQISFSQASKNNVDTTLFELSPHHMFRINPALEAGFGPTISYATTDIAGMSDSAFGLGIGASARYDITNKLFVGASARRVWGADYEINNISTSSDNTKAEIKIGFQF